MAGNRRNPSQSGLTRNKKNIVSGVNLLDLGKGGPFAQGIGSMINNG
jgi:hypothetical protein